MIQVLDFQGDRVAVPAPGIDFVGPVEMFDVPREAPRQVVVFGADAAARFGEAFPDMARCPFGGAGDGIAFALEGTHLGRDQFGLIQLGDVVRQAIDRLPGDARMSRWTVLDGEGLAIRPADFAPAARSTISTG